MIRFLLFLAGMFCMACWAAVLIAVWIIKNVILGVAFLIALLFAFIVKVLRKKKEA